MTRKVLQRMPSLKNSSLVLEMKLSPKLDCSVAVCELEDAQFTMDRWGACVTLVARFSGKKVTYVIHGIEEFAKNVQLTQKG
jgi:hypothetical protein